VQRLRVLEDLARHARRLEIFAEQASQTSTWVLHLDDARFHLVLSPEVWRGFPGEGQALHGWAKNRWQSVLPRVQAELSWQAKLDVAAIAKKLNAPKACIQTALQALGSRGLCGFDLTEGGYFHRVLPFDLAKVESLQPRLRAARKLLDRKGVKIEQQHGEKIEALVAGSGVEHTVRLNGHDSRCTCPWFAKHRALRGPCKHILAVQIALEDDDKHESAP
jgi:predicted nucleic acid-binding Zn finger protein